MVKLKWWNTNFRSIKTRINKILVSKKVFSAKKGFKYFIGYKDGKKVRPLCVMLPKMTAYKRDFDETEYVTFDKK